MVWLFASGGQSIGASTSALVLPMNIQGWFSLGLTGLISLLSKGFSRVFSAPLKASVWAYLPMTLGNYLVYLYPTTLVSSFQLNNLPGEIIIISCFKASLPMWAGPDVMKWLPKSQTKFLENILILSKSTMKPHSDSVISMNYDCECYSNMVTIRYS